MNTLEMYRRNLAITFAEIEHRLDRISGRRGASGEGQLDRPLNRHDLKYLAEAIAEVETLERIIEALEESLEEPANS